MDDNILSFDAVWLFDTRRSRRCRFHLGAQSGQFDDEKNLHTVFYLTTKTS